MHPPAAGHDPLGPEILASSFARFAVQLGRYYFYWSTSGSGVGLKPLRSAYVAVTSGRLLSFVVIGV